MILPDAIALRRVTCPSATASGEPKHHLDLACRVARRVPRRPTPLAGTPEICSQDRGVPFRDCPRDNPIAPHRCVAPCSYCARLSRVALRHCWGSGPVPTPDVPPPLLRVVTEAKSPSRTHLRRHSEAPQRCLRSGVLTKDRVAVWRLCATHRDELSLNLPHETITIAARRIAAPKDEPDKGDKPCLN